MLGAPVFTFITTDPRSKPTREAIKVHVLRRRHHQGRKEDQRLRRPRSVEGHHGGQFHIWDRVSALDPSSPNACSITRKRSPYPTTDRIHNATLRESVSSPTSSFDEQLLLPETESTDVVTIPRSPPGASEELLVHYYFLEDGGSGVTQSWLQCFKSSTASFTAFLAISSCRFLLERGIASAVDAQEKEVQALQEVTKQINLSPSAPTAGTMLAVALLANLQELRNEHLLAQWHWNGLKRMVDVNGGVRSLRIHEELHTFLFWLDALICNASVTPLGQESDKDLGTGPNLPHPMQELASFLDYIGTSHFSQQGGKASRTESVPSISRVLQRSSANREPYNMMKTFRAKLASLIYFASLKMQHKISLTEIEIYQDIAWEVEQRELGHEVFPVELFYTILALSNRDGFCHLIYTVSRLMNAIKKLGRDDCNVAARLLSAFTTHPNPFDDSKELLHDWKGLSSRIFSTSPRWCFSERDDVSESVVTVDLEI